MNTHKNDTALQPPSPSNALDKQNPKIVVIDSGAGGLSIVVEIFRSIHSLEVLYMADTAYFPYGEMPKSNLLLRLDTLVRQASKIFNPDLFVIACNTASTLGLKYLREKYDSKFVGVVPAVKPASEQSKTGNFAILATPSTVTSDYIKDLVNTFAHDKTVSLLGTADLVNIAEDHINGKTICTLDIENLLLNIIRSSDQSKVRLCDTLVLACTHFPLIKDQITLAFQSVMSTLKNDTQASTSLNHELLVLDSGKAIAKRVMSLLINEYSHKLDRSKKNNIEQSITIATTSKDPSNQGAQAYEHYLRSVFSDLLTIKQAPNLN